MQAVADNHGPSPRQALLIALALFAVASIFIWAVVAKRGLARFIFILPAGICLFYAIGTVHHALYLPGWRKRVGADATPINLDPRRPVWAAMSELFLDTELSDFDIECIAGNLAASPYTEEQLAYILRREVGLVLGRCFQTVAWEWTAFDQDWLEGEIMKHQGAWGRWFPPYDGWDVISVKWTDLHGRIARMRASP